MLGGTGTSSRELGQELENLHARAVFFVSDAQRSLDFYTKTLGFALDWTHKESERPFVFQVSLLGFQLILNQAESWTEGRAGHGRVFIGIEDNQFEAFRLHIASNNIKTTAFHWGAPTTVIHDLDKNELFFWLPQSEREKSDGALSEE